MKRSLERKNIYEQYDNEVQKILTKGYAEPVPRDEYISENKTWYLPHQPVVSDKKPGKLRVVFDCAARYRGESLNDKALQGPDLNDRLSHVILRFREHPYAFMADVEAMYNQVHVPEEDRHALRFLWYDKDGTVQYYRISRHLFGGVWCASAATYALRCSADGEVDPRVQDTIHHAFYVDDCLKSVGTRDDAEAILHGTRETLARRGFHRTKFVTNDQEVLFNLPTEEVAKEIHFNDKTHHSKALGIEWDVVAEEFYFSVLRCDDTQTTKRDMLSYRSSLYDPLSLIGPVTLKDNKVNWRDEDIHLELGDDDPEVKRQVSHRTVVTGAAPLEAVHAGPNENTEDTQQKLITPSWHPIEKLISRYSSWKRIIKMVAWLLKIKRIIRNPADMDKRITTEDLEESENEIIRYTQKSQLVAGLMELRQENIYGILLDKGITWKFTHPHSSHMGGVWERQMRTIRKVLQGVIQEQSLNDESLRTLMCEVESILNNRPITAVSDGPNVPLALKPNHLLLLREGPPLPPRLSDEADRYKRRWRQVQYLVTIFWKRWVKQYLPELQRRQKWLHEKPNISVGDLVLMVDESVPRGLWPMARVIETYPGKDGLVRSVKIRTKNTQLVRPIAKLVMLEGKLY